MGKGKGGSCQQVYPGVCSQLGQQSRERDALQPRHALQRSDSRWTEGRPAASPMTASLHVGTSILRTVSAA